MQYDVIIVGAGPGGIFAAYELMQCRPELKVAVFEAGHELSKRKCPIGGEKIKTCIGCKSCSIMSGFGGAGAFSDGKYNITNDFGGTLYEYIGKKQALDLMRYVDEINLRFGGEGTKLYSTAGTRFKTICIQHDLHLLDASVRHLGTDINYVVLENIYAYLKDKVDFFFDTAVLTVAAVEGGYEVICKETSYDCTECIISVGRSGSKWMESVCKDLDISTKSNRVDIGVRHPHPGILKVHCTLSGVRGQNPLSDAVFLGHVAERNGRDVQAFIFLVNIFCSGMYTGFHDFFLLKFGFYLAGTADMAICPAGFIL